MGSRLGGSSPDALALDGLGDDEDHLDGLWDNGVWVDGDDNDNDSRGDDDGLKVDSAQYAMTEILDALHCGWDPTNILPKTPFDRDLDLWKDHEKLGRAQVSLAAKSKDPHMDIFLRTRLTGMLGVLNLYLDPVLWHTWTEASLIVACIQGSGGKCACNLCKWILDFVQVGELPFHRYRAACWSLLDHEDIKEAIQLHLRERTKGGHIMAKDVVEVVSTTELQSKFSQSRITKPSISESTACCWLSRLNWQYGQPQKGLYMDRHEREDVVSYRDAFVKRWKNYEKCFHLWDNENRPLPLPKGFPVPGAGGRFHLILVTHDESIFYQNDLHKSCWAHKVISPPHVTVGWP
jgi:hypothetical protein